MSYVRRFRPSLRWSLGLYLALAVLVGSGPLRAQDPAPDAIRPPTDTTVIQEAELRDGTTLRGRVVAVDGPRILFVTVGGVEIALMRRDIRRLRTARGRWHRSQFWPDDPSDSRLFLAPTARVPADGQGYVGVYELFVPSFGVGIGGIGQLSGGFSALPGLPLREQVFYVAPKLQLLRTESVQGAVGLLWAKPGTAEESVGLVYTGLTGGGVLGSVTVLVAFPFTSRGGFAEEQLVMLGGELRVTPRLKLMTENWVAPGAEGSILSGGVRILAGNVTVELAVATSSDGGFLPVVNFSVGW